MFSLIDVVYYYRLTPFDESSCYLVLQILDAPEKCRNIFPRQFNRKTF